MGKILKEYLAKADDPRFTEGYSVVTLRKPVQPRDERKDEKKTRKKKEDKNE